MKKYFLTLGIYGLWQCHFLLVWILITMWYWTRPNLTENIVTYLYFFKYKVKLFIDFTILFVKLAKTVYKKGKKANQRFDKCIINTICINQIV